MIADGRRRAADFGIAACAQRVEAILDRVGRAPRTVPA